MRVRESAERPVVAVEPSLSSTGGALEGPRSRPVREVEQEAAAARGRAPWLESPPVDLALLLGVPLMAAAMGIAATVRPALFLPLLTLHVWLFSFDHVIATYTKLVGTPEDRRRNRALVFVLGPLCLAATLLVGALRGIGALYTIYFFFQWFHMTRQSWGIAQHYRRRAGGMVWDPRWLSEVTVWSVPVAGLLHRASEQPERFLLQPFWLPAVPRPVAAAAVLVAGVLVAWLAGTRLGAARRGALSLPHTVYLTTHLLVFAVAYLWLDDLHGGWLVVNVWHNVQYLVYVWMHNRQRFGGGVRDDARLLSWSCQPGVWRGVGYFVGCLAISTPLFGGLYAGADRVDDWLGDWLASEQAARLGVHAVPMAIVLALAINFHHYLVDGVIWKRRSIDLLPPLHP